MEDYNQMKLSIIIPLYNAEKYISTCLDSIFGSDLKSGEFEVVVVNDGSKDQGPAIVESYQKKHPEIQIVHQENKGQGAARNTGIEHANGDYVWFVDADDKIRETLQPLLKYIDSDKRIDMLSFKLDVVDVQGKFLYSGRLFFSTGDQIISGRDAFMKGANPGSACTTLFRLSFLREKALRFTDKRIMHQDAEFVIRALALADRVISVNDFYYYYILRNDSYTMLLSHQTKKIKDTVEVCWMTEQFIKSLYKSDVDLANCLYDHNQRIILGLLLSMFQNRKEWNGNGVNQEVLSLLKKYHFYPLRYRYKSWKQNVVKRLLNFYF